MPGIGEIDKHYFPDLTEANATTTHVKILIFQLFEQNHSAQGPVNTAIIYFKIENSEKVGYKGYMIIIFGPYAFI